MTRPNIYLYGVPCQKHDDLPFPNQKIDVLLVKREYSKTKDITTVFRGTLSLLVPY